MFVRAEPPAPNSNYLPPQARPSSQYGAPSFGNSAPSSQYGAPSNQYIPPSSNGFNNGNNNYQQSPSYSAPAVTSAIFKQPSSSYGAPSQNNGYSSGAGAASGYGSNGGYENNEPAKYNFEYNVQDYPSGNDFGHMESRDGDRTVGRYYVLLPDGRKQV